MKATTRREFVKTCAASTAACGIPPAVLGAEQATKDVGKTAEAGTPEPAYLALHRTGELKQRGERLWKIMRRCELCPRRCETERLAGKEGFCRASAQLEVSSVHPHFGEEKPLVGRGGSGTVFFTNCSLRCVFCINFQVSHLGQGKPRSVDELAWMMLALQKRGCANINVVTPTHYSPHILLALDKAAARGLRLPLVYNTCGWERLEILRTLDGVVDIYLPDFKYADPKMAFRYSAKALTYPKTTSTSLLEMQRQVGTAKPDKDGLVRRGVMVRHLVMPNNVGGTRRIIRWIARNLPKDTYFNLMSQYTPYYRAWDFPQIARRITRAEYLDAVRCAREAGLTNVDVQGVPWI